MSTATLSRTGAKISHMSRSDIVRAGATPEFVTLCKTLYGDVIDPDEIWEEVIKFSPDQADLNAASNRNKFERASNALGLTAGLMATGAAVRDPRLAQGGKVARGIYSAGRRVPSPISRHGGKAGAGLAVGALGTQVANTTGDIAIGSSYNDRAKAEGKKKLKRTGRKMGTKSAAAGSVQNMLPGFEKLVAGRKAADKAVTGTLLPVDQSVGQMPLPGLSQVDVPNAPGKVARRAGKVGRAVRGAFATPEGRRSTAVGGVLGATGVVAAQKGKKRYATSGQVNYYGGKRDDSTEVEWAGTFSKFDEDKQLAFGWASVSKVNGQPVVDKQGDYIDPGDLEDAAYQYVLGSRVGGAMHKRDIDDQPIRVADIVESMVFTDDKVAKMGLPNNFNRGWWVGMKIHDPEEWSLVKKGGRTGFSIHGKGIRKDQDEDELMGWY